MNWVGLSLTALVAFGVMNILITYLARKSIPVSFILLAIGFVFTIVYSIQTFVSTKFSFEINLSTLLILLVASLLSVVGNWTLYTATRDAPNPGLAIAVTGLNAGLVAILAIIFFRDKLTLMQIAGIFFGIISILLISIGSVNSK